MNKLSTVGARIKQARKKSNVSQSDMAKALSISDHQYYGRKERGEVKFSDAELLDAADFLNLNFQWLKSGIGEEYKSGIVQEPEWVGHEIFTKGVITRFNQQFDEYVGDIHRGSTESACRELKIKPNIYRKLKGGFQGFSQEVLQNLCRYGNFDINFLLANKGARFIKEEVDTARQIKELQREISELRKDKENMSSLIEMYRDKYEIPKQKRA